MPTLNGPPSKVSKSAAHPNATLYVINLPDKLRKPDLRLSLYTLFSTYGPVLDVVAMKTEKMRGQAHVVFRDPQTSTQAMRSLQDFDFFGKPLKIQYAKDRSNVFARLDPDTYKKAPAKGSVATGTQLQQSVFNAPPSSTATVPSILPPSRPVVTETSPDDDGPHGTKRRREDEEVVAQAANDKEDAPMDEDDDDVSMEASSDED
ncbi:U2 snRNP complex subunit msl1 [Agyrium rufum]|nr:U2 snRNP complex subunit msl1 [Agyrium rufum]